MPAHTPPSSSHLSVDGITHAFADRRVLTDVSFSASPGDRIGLVGENGSGKSTLLSILGGMRTADAGSVTHRRSFGLLQQELPYPPDTPVRRVLDDAQSAALGAQAEIEAAGARLAEHPGDDAAAEAYALALEGADRAGAWEAAARRGAALAGLGLGGIAEHTPLAELSGGQQQRLALAALLLEAPFTLLLDEPSNHLDDDAARYLEQTLANWRGIVVVASHDRSLLDAVTTRILDLDPAPVPAAVLADAADAPTAEAGAAEAGTAEITSRATDDPGTGLGVRAWGMGYTAMRAAQRDERRRWADLYAAQLQEREALVHEIEIGSREVNKKHDSKSEARITRKFYADKGARVTARRARNARVRLSDLERERVRRPPEPLSFSLPRTIDAVDTSDSFNPQPADRPSSASASLLHAREVALAGRLSPIDIEIGANDRVLVEGPNGAGKSTLLAILAGALEPSSGELLRADGLRIGYLPQDSVFADPERSVLETYERAVGAELAETRSLASLGLLAERDLGRQVRTLSVGQRRRLALATLIADPPPLLLLDEPSNHLSLTLVEELDIALRNYPGAVVIASHDRWLRSRWSGRRIGVTPQGTEHEASHGYV